MTARIIFAALLLALTSLLCCCASALETERVILTPHEDMDFSAPEAKLEAADYDGLLTIARDLLERGQISGRVSVFEYDGGLDALDADAASVREELLYHDALGSYALSDIQISVTPIVSYMDVQIELFYRRTADQIDKIITVSTQRYLRTELLSMMSDYREDAAVLTNLSVTVDEVLSYLSELYYENPQDVVMLPITTVEVYPPEPAEGRESLIEFTFAYSQPNPVLAVYSSLVKSAVRDVAEAVSGENDAEILLSLCAALSELSEYDAALGSLSEYSTQRDSATAYGALIKGAAIGEGYAMAFKALCDSLTLPCVVVPGTRDGLPYAWNIVSYDGSAYHIDPALCDELGFEEGFFKNDSEMSERYVWDREKYPVCNGSLTYHDIAGTSEQADIRVEEGEAEV